MGAKVRLSVTLLTLAFVTLGAFSASAGSILSGRIIYLHWSPTDQLRITAKHPDGTESKCPAMPGSPTYGSRLYVPDVKRLNAAVLTAYMFHRLVNLYWDDKTCEVVGLDSY